MRLQLLLLQIDVLSVLVAAATAIAVSSCFYDCGAPRIFLLGLLPVAKYTHCTPRFKFKLAA